MNSTIITKSFAEPIFSENEILRYAGCKTDDGDIAALVKSCIDEARDKLVYKICYRELPVSVNGSLCDFGCMEFHSKGLSRNLSGCHSVIVFAATTGIGIDRLIAKYSRISPSRALIMQALGAERTEALCDVLCEEIRSEKKTVLRPRFSPGYGDLPIDAQKDIFRLLSPEKNIGLCLSGSMLMTPSKSVTAFIGIENDAKCTAAK